MEYYLTLKYRPNPKPDNCIVSSTIEINSNLKTCGFPPCPSSPVIDIT